MPFTFPTFLWDTLRYTLLFSVDGFHVSGTTEIIPIKNGLAGEHYNGGNLNFPRYGFGLVAIGGHYKKVLAIGSQQEEYHVLLDTGTEEWDDHKEEWKPSSISINTPYTGAYLAVPPQLVCPSTNWLKNPRI